MISIHDQRELRFWLESVKDYRNELKNSINENSGQVPSSILHDSGHLVVSVDKLAVLVESLLVSLETEGAGDL